LGLLTNGEPGWESRRSLKRKKAEEKTLKNKIELLYQILHSLVLIYIAILLR
jgi:hypothetical protein